MRLNEIRNDGLGPQPQEGQAIVDRAIELGALSPDTARRRAELNSCGVSGWPGLLAWGYMKKAREGYYYAAKPDGSAERSIFQWRPAQVTFVLAVLGLGIAALVRVTNRH